MESETFLRHDSVVADVDVRQRLITLIAVPWNQEAKVPWRGEEWNEVFRRGAFDGLEDSIGRIKVNREHVIGDTVGRAVWADPYAEDGLITRAKIATGPRGEDTLGLAEVGALSGSVGFRVADPGDVRINRRTRLREVVRAVLHHLSLVEQPAYAGAEVLDVREDREVDEKPPAFARTLDEAWSDPDYLRALDRLSSANNG